MLLSQKGVKNLKMVMNSSHIRENVLTEEEAKSLGLRVDKHTHYHGLGENFFLQIIDGLDDVKEAYRSTKNADDPMRRENYFLLIFQFPDKSGNVINVPVYVNETAQYNRVFIVANKIATVFGREDFREYIAREIKKGNLVKIKNKSNTSSEHNALIAKGYRNIASNGSISNSDENVNTKSNLGQNVDETQDFFSLSDKAEDIGPVGDFSTPLNTMYYGEDADTVDDIGPVKDMRGAETSVSDVEDIASVISENAITEAPISLNIILFLG